jgi:uncharacterized protein (DUF362 family)
MSKISRRQFLSLTTAAAMGAVATACAPKTTEAPTPLPTEAPSRVPTAEPSPTSTAHTTTQPTATAESLLGPSPTPTAAPPVATTRPAAQVAFVKTQDRAAGVNKALNLLAVSSIKGKDLFLKPNFNSADAAPGSTHDDTLSTLVQALQAAGAGRITVGDRSGMGDTRSVMQQKGVFRMADELGFDVMVFDELDANDWELMQFEGSHWQTGFAVARPALEADGVIQTCCLKTHGYGGHFTMSLKNSVGLVAALVPGENHDYMSELHSSPHQRRMIAEINVAYQPDLIVVDGVEAFVGGGPDRGKLADAQVILAGTDRVAIDAVGVALLRYFGTTPAVSQGSIFEQEQIARAVELGLGVPGPEHIELVTGDPESAAYAEEIKLVL